MFYSKLTLSLIVIAGLTATTVASAAVSCDLGAKCGFPGVIAANAKNAVTSKKTGTAGTQQGNRTIVYFPFTSTTNSPVSYSCSLIINDSAYTSAQALAHEGDSARFKPTTITTTPVTLSVRTPNGSEGQIKLELLGDVKYPANAVSATCSASS